MTKRYTESEYTQLRSVRRAKQRQLENQDRLIKKQMLEEDRAESAKRRKANRQVKMDRVIGYIQAIADECMLNDENEFIDFDAIVSFLAIRGVMSWPRTRFSAPTHEEKVFITKALDQAQERGLISIPKEKNGKRKLINHFPTLPSHGVFLEDELFVFGKRFRRELVAA